MDKRKTWKRKTVAEARVASMMDAKLGLFPPGPTDPEDPPPYDSSSGRGSSSEDETELDEETVQELFDDWAVSLPSLDRKFLAVGLVSSQNVNSQNVNTQNVNSQNVMMHNVNFP